MDVGKKRLTLDLESGLQRRVKVIAALRGISMRQYCQSAIEKELARDEQAVGEALPFGEAALARLAALQARVFQGRKLSGDSTELIRETRTGRSASQ